MKKIIVGIISAFCLQPLVYAHGIDYLHTKAHEHGTADAFIEWQGAELTVTAIFPAQDVVGFERMPENAKEKRLLRDIYQTFIDKPVITAETCVPKQVNVDSALFDDHNHTEDEASSFISDLLGAKEEERDEVPDHIDFQAKYTFDCLSVVKSLTFNSFSTFSGLTKIRVYLGGKDEEPTQILTPNNPIFKQK